jgi:hypothetical protein
MGIPKRSAISLSIRYAERCAEYNPELIPERSTVSLSIWCAERCAEYNPELIP